MKYAALFRGINVGGKNIVKMASLKKLFLDLGFGSVRTYIQSGNIVFEAEEKPDAVAGAIRAGFKTTYGFESALTLHTANEMDAIVQDMPFSLEEIADAEASNPEVEHLYVYLMDNAERGEMEQIAAGYAGPDKLCAGRREIYLLCHQSIRDSKLAALHGKLGVPMTARNWKTINKLCEMLHE